jgi:hypothetical protein
VNYLNQRRQQDDWTRGHLEALAALFSVRIVCERLDVLVRQGQAVKAKMTTLGGRMARTTLIATLHSGPCTDCGIEIGWGDSSPTSP